MKCFRQAGERKWAGRNERQCNVRQTTQGTKRLLQKIRFTNKTQFHLLHIFKGIPIYMIFMDKDPYTVI